MAKYRIFKTDNYTRINAFLEDLSDGGQNITFMPVLRPEYAQYIPVELLIPAELRPDVYENADGMMLLKMIAPTGCAFCDMEPAAFRLPIETVGGRDYAFRDFRSFDVSIGDFTGWTYRVRIAFERT